MTDEVPIEDAELLRAILDAADQRFAYVAFLTDRCERGRRTDLGEAIAAVVPSDEGRDFATDESLALSQVLLALDRARVDRNYRSPTYLRTDLAAFLASRPSGIYWLQAAAHVGKTTFIQGLAGDIQGPAEDGDLAEAHINGDFARESDGRIVAYYCRKEHRTGVVGLINLTIGACRRAPPALR